MAFGGSLSVRWNTCLLIQICIQNPTKHVQPTLVLMSNGSLTGQRNSYLNSKRFIHLKNKIV